MAIRIRIGKILGAIVALPSSVAATTGHLTMAPTVPMVATVIAGAVGAMLVLELTTGGNPWPMAGILALLAGAAELGRHMVARDKVAPFLGDLATRTLALAEQRREVEARETAVATRTLALAEQRRAVEARETAVAEREAAVRVRATEVATILSTASQTALARHDVSLAVYRRAKTAMTQRRHTETHVSPVSADDVLRGRHD